MSNVFIKDNYLYLEYKYYAPMSGYRENIEKINLDDICFLQYFQGPQGGDHGWEICGFDKYDYGEKENKAITSFGRKHGELLIKVMKLLKENKIKCIKKDSEQAPCF